MSFRNAVGFPHLRNKLTITVLWNHRRWSFFLNWRLKNSEANKPHSSKPVFLFIYPSALLHTVPSNEIRRKTQLEPQFCSVSGIYHLLQQGQNIFQTEGFWVLFRKLKLPKWGKLLWKIKKKKMKERIHQKMVSCKWNRINLFSL